MHFFSCSPKTKHILGKMISSWCCSWTGCRLLWQVSCPSQCCSSVRQNGSFQEDSNQWCMVLLSYILPHLSCKNGSCDVMYLLPQLGCAFPSTDVWSLVSPTNGLVLSASLSINCDAFSSIYCSPRDLTRTCAVYWWLCWPTRPPHPSDFWVATVGC